MSIGLDAQILSALLFQNCLNTPLLLLLIVSTHHYYYYYYYHYYYYYGRALARIDVTNVMHVLLSMATVLISWMSSSSVSPFNASTKVVVSLPLLVRPVVGCQRTRLMLCFLDVRGSVRQALIFSLRFN